MGKMKAPTKQDLRDIIAAQEQENIKLIEQMNAERVRLWQERLPLAFSAIKRELAPRFGGLVRLLRFEHVDAAGYWFTFELENDTRRQTWRVGHNEI